jgi:hypothetical protein
VVDVGWRCPCLHQLAATSTPDTYRPTTSSDRLQALHHQGPTTLAQAFTHAESWALQGVTGALKHALWQSTGYLAVLAMQPTGPCILSPFTRTCTPDKLIVFFAEHLPNGKRSLLNPTLSRSSTGNCNE